MSVKPENLNPCLICGKPAKTIYNSDGTIYLAGLHRSCFLKASYAMSEDEKRKMLEPLTYMKDEEQYDV